MTFSHAPNTEELSDLGEGAYVGQDRANMGKLWKLACRSQRVRNCLESSKEAEREAALRALWALAEVIVEDDRNI